MRHYQPDYIFFVCIDWLINTGKWLLKLSGKFYLYLIMLVILLTEFVLSLNVWLIQILPILHKVSKYKSPYFFNNPVLFEGWVVWSRYQDVWNNRYSLNFSWTKGGMQTCKKIIFVRELDIGTNKCLNNSSGRFSKFRFIRHNIMVFYILYIEINFWQIV